MIKNVVFDMGNVLIRFDPEYFLNREEITLQEDRKTVMKELFHSVEWAMMDRGDLTENSAEPLILARIPDHLKDKVRNLLYHWAVDRDIIPGMYELVYDLKEKGYCVYLLSNASLSQPEYWKKYPVSRLMDGTLISALERCVKPSDQIYHIFTKRFGLREEECVFIDDTPANVAAAIANGWAGFVFYGDAEECRKNLHQLGVLI